MLPSTALKKLQRWIRSRHLICAGNFFLFETVDYTTIERFANCTRTLGGSVIRIHSIGKVWIGNHRQVILYQVKASLHTPQHNLKQYWLRYGSYQTRFDLKA